MQSIPTHARIRAREYGTDVRSAKALKAHCAQESYQRFRHVASLDACDDTNLDVPVSVTRWRSKVQEIVSSADIVIVLTLGGVCAAFRGKARLCFLNKAPDEVIRSLFHNKSAKAIITVSVSKENGCALSCRSTPIECIRRGQPDAGVRIFATESLRWPGFVEFDDVNGKALTFACAAEAKQYRVWSLENYELLFSLPSDAVTEVKISPGIMLLVHSRQGAYIPLKIVSIETGAVLKDFQYCVRRSKKVEFIELFNDKLLVKQKGENLDIMDVHNGSIVSVSKTDFLTPSAFIFLYEKNHFLTFRGRSVACWNFAGEQVAGFEDHSLWHPDTNPSNVFITSDQNYIMSYCQPKRSQIGRVPVVGDDESPSQQTNVGEEATGAAAGAVPDRGAIHISDVLTGKCVARLRGNDVTEPGSLDMGDVTCISFSEECHELYVGNRQGFLHVWS